MSAGLPPSDSVNVWPVLSTVGAGGPGTGPRKSIVTGFTCGTTPCNTYGDPELGPVNAALLDADGYKLVVGNSADADGSGTPGLWWGPSYPNASAGPDSGMASKPCGEFRGAEENLTSCVDLPGGAGCGDAGCLFQVFTDVGERNDLSSSMASRKAAMMVRLKAVAATVFQSDMNASFPENFGAADPAGSGRNLTDKHAGFLVPWL